MATTGSDFLQGLNMILTAREERERFQLQQSLAMMQFAQQKRVSDIQIASETLKLTEAANNQQKHRTASRFITDTGLGRYYLGGEGDKRIKNLNESISKLQKEKKFSPEEASRVVSALWAFNETKDPDPIIGIAAGLGRTVSKSYKGDEIIPGELKQLKSYWSSISTAEKDPKDQKVRKGMENVIFDSLQLLNNERMITKEMMEFAKGDYKIQSDIGLVDKLSESFDSEAAKKGGTVDLLPFSVQLDAVEQALTAGENEDDDWEISPGLLMGGGFASYQLMKGPVKEAIGTKVSAEKTFYEELAKDSRRHYKPKDKRGRGRKINGLSRAEFRAKYNLPDNISKNDVMGKDNKAMKHIARQAKRRGWSSMKAVQSLKGISDSKLWKGLGKVFKYPARMGTGGYATLTMFGGAAGGELGEALGDRELGELIGKGTPTAALGARLIANRAKAHKMSFWSFLKARIPKVGARAAGMALADSPVVPIGDILAAGYTIYEIYNTYKLYNNYMAED